MASGTMNLNTYKAILLAKQPTLTIGATGKTFDGTVGVSFSKDEILGGSGTATFLRADKTWTNTITLASGSSGEFRAARGSIAVWMGIGSGNENHGLYSEKKADWMIYCNVSGSVQVNGNSATATILQTARNFTIGATAKSFNGSAAVSWTMNEIMGSSDSTKFYRGDKVWSNAIQGNFIAGDSKNSYYHLYTARSGSGGIHHEFVGGDCDYGVVKIRHLSTEGSGGPGAFSAALGIFDERTVAITGSYQPTLYVKRTGTVTTVAPLFGIDNSSGRVFTVDYQGNCTATKFIGPLQGNVTGNVTGNAATATDADKLDGRHGTGYMQSNGNDTSLGSGSPAATVKTYFLNTDKVPNSNMTAVYCNSGTEYAHIFSRTGNCGSVIRWTYANKYMWILRYEGGAWKSDDFEKMSAGYADTCGDADTLDGKHASAFLTSHQSLSNYVTLDGDQTITGKKTFQKQIIAYAYKESSSLPFIVFDKPGSYWAGIGPDGTGNRIKFGPNGGSGQAWTAQSTFNSNQWFFQGSIYGTSTLTIEGATTISGSATVSGGLISNHGHNLMVGGNEVNFIPNSYNSTFWFNYTTFGRDNSGTITNYYFGNGKAGWNTTALYSGKVYNAVWNDFAEYRESDITEPGRVLVPSDGKMVLCQERLAAGARVVSDTFGCSVGMSDTAQTPIGVAGRVLAHPYQNRNNYKPGDAVCAAPSGTVDIMTREEIKEYPDRVIGIVDEVPTYERWEQYHTCYKEGAEPTRNKVADVEVKGRIWIYVR